jgi:hypothetical protein
MQVFANCNLEKTTLGCLWSTYMPVIINLDRGNIFFNLDRRNIVFLFEKRCRYFSISKIVSVLKLPDILTTFPTTFNN